MTPSLFDNLESIGQRMAAAPHLLLGLDYDGTLTPIVNDPARATLDPAVRKLVQKVAARPRTSVAVVSGRRLRDVESLVDVSGLIYAGNHGLEIAGSDFRFVEPTAVKKRKTLGMLAPLLQNGLANIPGAIVENKDLTIAVHCRQVSRTRKEEVFRHVHAAVSVVANSFRISPGNEVFEIRPRVEWHKGRALLWIADQLKKPGILTVFVGDDQTDEEAFLALDDGITVKVGDFTATHASYRVEGPAEVARFLQWLAELG
jgi:trehalose-phosphatase